MKLGVDESEVNKAWRKPVFKSPRIRNRPVFIKFWNNGRMVLIEPLQMPALQTTHMAEGSSGGYAQNHLTSYLGRKGGCQTVLSFNIDEVTLNLHSRLENRGFGPAQKGID